MVVINLIQLNTIKQQNPGPKQQGILKPSNVMNKKTTTYYFITKLSVMARFCLDMSFNEAMWVL